MPIINCPKCNQAYDMHASDIGKHCECHCGHKFMAKVTISPAQMAQAKQKLQVQPALPKGPRRVNSVTASCFRILSFFSFFCGIIVTIVGIADNNEIGRYIGIAGVLSALSLFASSLVINALLQIEENTRFIAEKYIEIEDQGNQ